LGLLTLLLAVASALLFDDSAHPSGKPAATDDPDKVFLFAVDGIKRPLAFVDDFGFFAGIDLEIMKGVCAVAGKKCEMVLAPFQECSFSQRGLNMPGKGLMAGDFDVCPSYSITVDRQSTFDFTLPYLHTVATFTLAPGNPFNFSVNGDPDSDTPHNFRKWKLMHLNGAPTNERCMNRLGWVYNDFAIASDLPDAKAALLNGSVAAVFSPRKRIPGLDVLPARFHCDKDGAGMMVKKGSTIPSWWNPAFRAFYNSGNYTKTCEQAKAKFNFEFMCLDPPASSPGRR